MKTIVITGPSGSGKTFLANKLSRDLNNCIIIKTDSYYRDNLILKLLSIFIYDLYDRFVSIKQKDLLITIKSIYRNKKNITFYNYNFKSKESTKLVKKKNNNTQYLIIEGIFSHRLNINYKSAVNILCSEKKENCFARRLRRDKLERGRNTIEVNKRFSKSWDLFYKHSIGFIKRNQVYVINTANKSSYSKLIDKIKIHKKT